MWLEGIAATGVHVKPLDSKPDLLAVDLFYYNMYHLCGSSFENVRSYCGFHGMDGIETLEAMEIINQISSGVNNASS